MRWLVLVFALAASGCALTSKGDALAVRWYSPETTKPRLTSASQGEPANGAPTVELGRVTSGINLRERIAFRDTAYEVGYFDDRRWTERPEVYVERALARTLFEERGMRRALAGQAPILDVEVLSFEMVRRDTPAARVQLRIVLHDDRDAFIERTLTVERSAPRNGDFGTLVRAMADALDASVEEVANDVAVVVRTPPAGRDR